MASKTWFLRLDELIETDSLEQYEQLSHEMEALVVPKSTHFKPISKTKELEVTQHYMKLSPHKKRKQDTPREAENEHIPVLDPDTHCIDDVKLKNIQIKSFLVTIFEKGVFWKPEVLLDVYHHFGKERE